MNKKTLSLIACSILLSPLAAKGTPKATVDSNPFPAAAFATLREHKIGYSDVSSHFATISFGGSSSTFQVREDEIVHRLKALLLTHFKARVSTRESVNLYTEDGSLAFTDNMATIGASLAAAAGGRAPTSANYILRIESAAETAAASSADSDEDEE